MSAVYSRDGCSNISIMNEGGGVTFGLSKYSIDFDFEFETYYLHKFFMNIFWRSEFLPCLLDNLNIRLNFNFNKPWWKIYRNQFCLKRELENNEPEKFVGNLIMTQFVASPPGHSCSVRYGIIYQFPLLKPDLVELVER